MNFEAFPKIPRYKKTIVVTEKIDGTNAQICITRIPQCDDSENAEFADLSNVVATERDGDSLLQIRAGSRNRWIVPGDDNFGFARWVSENSKELTRLGEGRHFGEWWGLGIQRTYRLNEKRFSLFNTGRWTPESTVVGGYRCVEVPCCHVVPVLAMTENADLDDLMRGLKVLGSQAADFDKPEGIVVYHTASRQQYKMTFESDRGKWNTNITGETA